MMLRPYRNIQSQPYQFQIPPPQQQPYAPYFNQMGHMNGYNAYSPYGPFPYNEYSPYQYHSVPSQKGQQKKTGYLFQNPLQPEEGYMYESYPKKTYQQDQQKMSYIPKPSPIGSVMNSFKSQDGSLDFNKMINTAGQLVNAFNQVSGMAKGIGGLFKL